MIGSSAMPVAERAFRAGRSGHDDGSWQSAKRGVATFLALPTGAGTRPQSLCGFEAALVTRPTRSRRGVAVEQRVSDGG